MLHAIKNKKAGRNFNGTEVPWGELFAGSEDSLTSSVIGTLLYLPHNLIWKILNQALKDNIIDDSEIIEEVFFWPSWSPMYTRNVLSVEPDVFIQTTNYSIIIEAKVGDERGIAHDHEQWQKELIAYQNEYIEKNASSEEKKRSVIFIALGGNRDLKKTQMEIKSFTGESLPKAYDLSFAIHKMHWKHLLNTCIEYYKNPASYDILHNHSSIRILKDIINAFEIHRFSVIKLFGDIKMLDVSIDLFTRKQIDLYIPVNINTKFTDFTKFEISLYCQSNIKLTSCNKTI